MSNKQQPLRTSSLLLALVVIGGAHFSSAHYALADSRQGVDPLPQTDTPRRQSAIASDLDPSSDPLSDPTTAPPSDPATAPPSDPTTPPTSDPTTPPTSVVAAELLRLQQQLGGSVVTGRTELQGWKGPPAPVTARPTPAAPRSPAMSPQAPQFLPQQPGFLPQQQGPSSPDGSAYPPSYRGRDFRASEFQGRDLASAALPNLEVSELREAAWQLVTTAHRLEQLDLYDQADALRSLAQRLRQDARGMKQADRAAARALLEGRSSNE